MRNEILAGLTRRDVMRLSAAGVGGLCLSGWMNVLASAAAGAKTKTKSCILLYMDGGPSHKDTFDLKPGTKDGGDFKPIKTSVAGIEISEHFPNLAKQMQHGVIIRGMSTAEGAHARAKYNMHTGYREGVGGVVYPSIGSIVSAELGRPEFPLPNFVTVGARSYGAGFLGAKHHPLNITDPNRGVENLKPFVSQDTLDSRVGLLEQMEKAFYGQYAVEAAKDHATTYARAAELMKSKEARAFDLSAEPSASKSAYGSGRFSESCLLARRLVEVGVPFVEVGLGGWDTHQDNFARVANLSGQVDKPFAQLVADLQERGLLDSTLIVWMGDFGRTPKINARGAKPGRDHYPRAWSTLLFGGGIKGGQVIGKTDAEGANVLEGKTTAIDFMATICTILGINYEKQNNTPTGRPVRIVDKGGTPIKGLIG
jgi:uncharacterized protein (DUF1501 family)